MKIINLDENNFWDEKVFDNLKKNYENKKIGLLFWNRDIDILNESLRYLEKENVDLILSELLITELDSKYLYRRINFLKKRIVYHPPEIKVKEKNINSYQSEILYVHSNQCKMIEYYEMIGTVKSINEDDFKSVKDSLENITSYKKVILNGNNPNIGYAYIELCIKYNIFFGILNNNIRSLRTHAIGIRYNRNHYNTFRSKFDLFFESNNKIERYNYKKLGIYESQIDLKYFKIEFNNSSLNKYGIIHEKNKKLPSVFQITNYIELIDKENLQKYSANILTEHFHQILLKIILSKVNQRCLYYIFCSNVEISKYALSSIMSSNCGIDYSRENRVCAEDILMYIYLSTFKSNDNLLNKTLRNNVKESLVYLNSIKKQSSTDSLLDLVNLVENDELIINNEKKGFRDNDKHDRYNFYLPLFQGSLYDIRSNLDLSSLNNWQKVMFINGICLRLGIFHQDIRFFSRDFIQSLGDEIKYFLEVYKLMGETKPYNLLIILKHELDPLEYISHLENISIHDKLWCILHLYDIDLKVNSSSKLTDLKNDLSLPIEFSLFTLIEFIIFKKSGNNKLNHEYFKNKVNSLDKDDPISFLIYKFLLSAINHELETVDFDIFSSLYQGFNFISLMQSIFKEELPNIVR